MIFLVAADHFWISLGHLLSLFFQATERAYYAHKIRRSLEKCSDIIQKIDTREIFMIYSG